MIELIGNTLGRILIILGLLYQIMFMIHKKRAQVSNISFYILGVGTLITCINNSQINNMNFTDWFRLFGVLLFFIVGIVAHSFNMKR